MKPLIVTLDGPAGSGKSTVARMLAKRLGVEFLDTGAMYRGITVLCIEENLSRDQPGALAQRVREAGIRFEWKADPPRLQLAGHDVTQRLRDADVTSQVSDVSAIPAIRDVMVEAQRKIAHEHPRLVTEGRDQGSIVFPDAQVKFYLDATAAVRARRRAEQLREAGRDADEKRILQEIIDRDKKDSSRAVAPLICPPDAQRIDTSDLSLDEVVNLLQQRVIAKVGDVFPPGVSSGFADERRIGDV